VRRSRILAIQFRQFAPEIAETVSATLPQSIFERISAEVLFGSRRDMSHHSALVSIRADSRHPADQSADLWTAHSLDCVPGQCVWTGRGPAAEWGSRAAVSAGERTRIVNRIKATLARMGIRNFKPTLRKAAERLATLHTPEGMPLPPNVLAELWRDMARLGFVVSQIRDIEEARQKRLEQEPESGPHARVRLLARVVGVGIETADMLVHEVLSRPMRDRKAVARYAGLTGSPDESGAKRREQGLARAGNARVRRGMIQLAWRFLLFQKESALALWYRARTADSRVGTRKTMSIEPPDGYWFGVAFHCHLAQRSCCSGGGAQRCHH
jgi:hypothetical protein